MENNQDELRERARPYFTQQNQAADEIGLSHVTFNIFLKGGKIPEKHLPGISAWLDSKANISTWLEGKAQKKLPIG